MILTKQEVVTAAPLPALKHDGENILMTSKITRVERGTGEVSYYHSVETEKGAIAGKRYSTHKEAYEHGHLKVMGL